MSEVGNNIYTKQYMDFIESSERTGLLYEMALKRFDEGQVILKDKYNNKIVTPIITKDSFITEPNVEIISKNESFEDIDETWMDRVFTRLDYQNSGEIWNGDVVQVDNISSNKIYVNESTYFTLASHHEKYVSEIAEQMYNTNTDFYQKPKDISELNEIYSMMGITYTTIINPPSEDSRYILYGKRSPKMNELGSFRVVAPAGIVQPRHIEDSNSLDDVIQSHLTEEFPEELLDGVLTEDEFEPHIMSSEIEYSFNGFGIEPLRYATELAASVNITGEFARYVLNNLSINEEMSTINVYDVDSIKTVYSPIFSRGLTPQSLFSLGLYLEKEFSGWNLSIEEKPHY